MAQIKPFEYLIYDELTKHLTGTNGHHLTDNKIKMGAFKRYEHTHYDDLTQNKKDFLTGATNRFVIYTWQSSQTSENDTYSTRYLLQFTYRTPKTPPTIRHQQTHLWLSR